MDILNYINKMQKMYGDQASLADDLEPGALKDELLKDFDPSQETYEEYLQRKSLERPFNMAQGGSAGQLVAPSVDGSRPGYANDRKDVIEKAKKRAQAREKGLIYDTATKTFRKKEGVTYLTTTKKNKIKEAFPNVKLNFKLYPTTGVKKYLTKDQNKTNKTWAAINRFKNKGYTLEDLRTGGSGQLPPIEKGKISATELLEVINKASGTTYTSGYLTDPRPGKKAFLQNIIADTLNRELRTQVRTTKGYGKTKGPRTYYVFDKPTAAQLDFFVQYIDAPFLYDKTVRNVKILDKEIGKELAKSTKKDAVDYFTNNLTIDKVKQILKDNGVKNPTNYKAANAMTRYGQALQGKLFKNLDGITKNTKTGDFVFKAFNEIDRYHPWSQGAYTAILNDIDGRMGKQAGNLSQFKNAFKAKMKVLYPGRKFDFNEVFSLSTSANRGSYPYAYFVDLTSSAMNRGALAAYQGAASVAEGRIQTAIKNFRKTGNQKFYKEAVDIANVFNNQTRKKFLSSEKVLEYQKNYGIKPNALKIEIGSQRQVADKINIASNYFSDRNLQKWKNLGIDIDAHSGRAGYVKTFGRKGVPKNVITAGELFTEDTRLGKGKKIFDEKAVTNFLKNNLIALCGKSKGKLGQASGGRIGYQDAGAVGKTLQCGSKRLEQILLKGGANKNEQVLANSILKAGAGLKNMLSLKGFLGPAALAFTAATDAGIVGYDMLAEGKTFKEAVGDSVFNYALGPKLKIDSIEERNKRFRKLGVNEKDMGKIAAFESALGDIDRIKNIFTKDQTTKQKLKEAKNFFPVVVDKRQKEADAVRADIQDLARTGIEQRLMNVDYDAGAKALEEAKKLATIDRLTSRGPQIFGQIFPKAEKSRQQRILDASSIVNPAHNIPGMRELTGGYLYGFASGGLANLTNTIPPESGPMSQGLRSLYNNGKKL